MQYRVLVYFVGILLVIGMIQCANPIPLTGGEKDETPPGLDSTRTTPNMQTNFEKQTIELAFDEWVQLNDVRNQVVISPPIEPAPEINLRGKTVQIQFDETATLRENATYTINFGEAIQDLTERNPADNLRFVFSTGDLIDSLEVEGIVRDVEKNEPQEGVLVMLYDNLADSVVRTERPFYFAKTDETGHFHIQNVRADTFKVVVLDDQIPNYTYDATESIGFLEAPIIVPDTTRKELELTIFKAEEALNVLDIDTTQYGRADVLFNKKIRLEELFFKYENIPNTLFFEASKDTLHVWYELGELSNWELHIRQDTLWRDTLQVTNKGKQKFLSTAQLEPYKKLSPRQEVNPIKPLVLQWNHPLASFDTAFIQLYQDSILVEQALDITIDSTAMNRKLNIKHKWKEDSTYTIQLLPNALTDIYGIMLKDTVKQIVRVQESKALGNLNLTVIGLDSTQHYVVEVLAGSDAVFERFQVKEVSTFKTTLEKIKASTYSVRIVTDWNKNGYWDTGNYDLKRQAEPIFTKQLEALRANWDLEAEVNLVEETNKKSE